MTIQSTIAAPPARLVEQYIRWCGAAGRYEGQLPPHMVSQWSLPLVGALLTVGEHRRTATWCSGLLTSTQRSSDFAAAPPRGLTMVGVDYPPESELEARNLITRELRTRD